MECVCVSCVYVATITILGTKIGTGEVEDTLLSILTVVFLSVSISVKFYLFILQSSYVFYNVFNMYHSYDR